MSAPRQLPLDLPLPAASGPADFLVTPANAAAVAAVEGWAAWPAGRLVLVGPEGSGKSHLARVWAERADAAVVAAADLGRADLPALAGRGRIAVDGAEAVAGAPAGERALLHLANLLGEAGGRLLLTARQPPAAWGLGLADLASRLAASGLARLEAPDDALLAGVLVKLFADRQLAVTPAVIGYLLARMERSLAAAGGLVAGIDARALADRRRVTVPLVRAVLQDGAGLAPAALDRAGRTGA